MGLLADANELEGEGDKGGLEEDTEYSGCRKLRRDSSRLVTLSTSLLMDVLRCCCCCCWCCTIRLAIRSGNNSNCKFDISLLLIITI